MFIDNRSMYDDVVDINKFTDLLKLFRVTSMVLRFVKNLKRSVNKEKLHLVKYITVGEINEAKLLWIKANQHVLKKSSNYECEIKFIFSGRPKRYYSVTQSFEKCKNSI